jgi:hypothetical protein
MHSVTVKYQDYNNKPQTETFYFYMSKTSLMLNLDIREQMETVVAWTQEPERTLTESEVLYLLNLVKRIMELSYGVRSSDGREFDQDPDVWRHFKRTKAYEDLLFSLFVDVVKAFEFINAVFPEDLRAEAEEMVRKQNEAAGTPGNPVSVTPDQIISTPTNQQVPDDTRPEWLREGRVPTDEELRGSSPEHILAAMRMKLTA